VPESPISTNGHANGKPSAAPVSRPYSDEDVARLRGSVHIEHTLARRGAEKLRALLARDEAVAALGCLTGGQAVQSVKAGLKAIYLSGWQVAADANTAGQIYPDQSLYPYDSVPKVVERINNAFQRADQIDTVEGRGGERDWFAPIVADMEAGFGGPLNVFELAKSMIAAGAAGIHLEDQLASEKKCGHLGGKVLIPTAQAIRNLIAARLATDVCGVPTVLLARTDADAANLLLSDVDDRDKPFLTGERTPEGFFRVKPGIGQAIARGLAYAPYCDLIWCETSHPSLEEAEAFAKGIHAQFPGKMLAYNCSPSFNWKLKIDDATIAQYRQKLFELGYRFQFITLAGWHALNHSMFELAHDYAARGMTAYAEFQQREFASESQGYTATRHQREVGTGYFDEVAKVVGGGASSTTALTGSTEEAQFTAVPA
jgi:isocitrate lyase